MRSRTSACLLRGSICRKQEKQLKQKAACWRRKSEERTEDGGGCDWGPFSFWELRSFLLCSICIVLQLAARVGRERLNQKKVRRWRGPGGNTRSQKIYFSPSTTCFPGRNNTCRRKDMERDRQGQVGEEGWEGRAWMTYYRETYTLRNKAGEFKRNRINSLSWEALCGSSCDSSDKGSTWNPEHTLTEGSWQNLIINQGLQQEHTYKDSSHVEQHKSPQISVEFKGSD